MMFHKNENSGKGGLGGHASNQPPVVIESPVVYKYSPVTNADRIRSMTDEELAELMHDTTWEGRKTVEDPEAFKTVEEWLDWLREEASE